MAPIQESYCRFIPSQRTYFTAPLLPPPPSPPHLLTPPPLSPPHPPTHTTTLRTGRYAVAMIQEMFLQIDYNGDGGSDWNEFTTFLSLTGLRLITLTPSQYTLSIHPLNAPYQYILLHLLNTPSHPPLTPLSLLSPPSPQPILPPPPPHPSHPISSDQSSLTSPSHPPPPPFHPPPPTHPSLTPFTPPPLSTSTPPPTPLTRYPSDQSSLTAGGAGGDQQIGLNEYKIEYSEDPGRRDQVAHTHTLSTHLSTHPRNMRY